MAISKERMDRFTWQPGDIEIVKPAPKKKEKTQATKKATDKKTQKKA